jgi:hypothetical protein
VLTKIAARIAAVDPKDVTIWSGAGISANSPTTLPTGERLTQRVFDTFFDAGALEVVLGYHQAMGWHPTEPCPLTAKEQGVRVRYPRLETVLGVAVGVNQRDNPAPLEVLADFRDATPNRLHGLFAWHIARGGRHVTANFDRCIERAYSMLFPDMASSDDVPVPGILHFHGFLASDPTGASLGATLASIQGGFSAAMEQALVGSFVDAKLLVVAGYSASDFFDVDVAVQRLPHGRLDGLQVLWISHGTHGWHQLHPTEGTLPVLARHLRTAGAAVALVCGPTKELLDQLTERWGANSSAVDRPAASKAPTSAPPTPFVPTVVTLTVPEERRRAATFVLYRQLGLHHEASRVSCTLGVL